MDRDRVRETGQLIAVASLLVIPTLAVWSYRVSEWKFLFPIVVPVLWFLGGFVGLVVTRICMPIYKGCDCEKCAASPLQLLFGFVCWPVAVPLFLVVGIISALTRGALE